MKENISIDRDKLAQVLNSFRSDGETIVPTTKIIEKYMGGFNQNRGVAPSISWNAQFGKFLMSNSNQLGISREAANQKITLNGSATSTSIWNLNAIIA